jgi:RND family efflux transporter MFP subunit
MPPLKIAAALALATCAACNRSPSSQAGAGQGFPPTPVKLAVAETRPIADTTEYVATLRSLRSTTVQPQIDGQITQIFVRSGDRVAQGTPLLQIDPRRQAAAVSSQEAERAAREANVAFARQQLERSRELFAAGAISKQELEQAETALRTAEASLEALQAQVQQQQVQLRYYTVTAPTTGIVGDVPARVGSQVSPQTVLTTIDQNDTLELYVQVPVERAVDLKNGLPIEILSSDGSETLATTTVGFVSPHVDDQTQSVLVKGTVRNAAGALRSSQYVRARVVWKTVEGLVVPVTAVLRINGQYFAFVAEEGKAPDGTTMLVARQRAVQVGPISGDAYPLLQGVEPGERLVVSGAQKLADGAPIAPMDGAAASEAQAPNSNP